MYILCCYQCPQHWYQCPQRCYQYGPIFSKQDILFHVNDNYITTYRHKKYLEKSNLDQSKQSQSF